MSQQQFFSDGGAPGVPGIETVTGNTGGAVGGSGSPVNINILGDTVQGVTVNGNAGTNTETVTVSDATTTQKGVVALATNAETIAGSVTTKAITPDDLKAKLGSQTSHGLAYGAGQTSALAWLGEAPNGYLPIGSTGNAPVLAPITSTDGSIAITNGPGSINLSANQLAATVTTTNATPNDFLTFPLGATPGTYIFTVRTVAFNLTDSLSAGYEQVCTIRTTGAAGVVVTPQDFITEEEGAMSTADLSVVISGNSLVVRATGILAKTIHWSTTLNYLFVS